MRGWISTVIPASASAAPVTSSTSSSVRGLVRHLLKLIPDVVVEARCRIGAVHDSLEGGIESDGVRKSWDRW